MTNVPRFHEDQQAELAEYALGVLDGRARAELFDHLATCSDCEHEVERLTATAEALLRVPVSAEPPIGFESRVMERIHLESLGHSSPRWSSRMLTVAAALVVLSFGVGWALHQLTARSTTPISVATGHIEHRHLTTGGRDVGLVWAYTGRPSWMFVSVDAPGSPGTVRCLVVTNDGRRHLIGTFELSNGRGGWGTRLPVSIQTVRDIQLTSTSGIVVARLASTAWASAPSRLK